MRRGENDKKRQKYFKQEEKIRDTKRESRGRRDKTRNERTLNEKGEKDQK